MKQKKTKESIEKSLFDIEEKIYKLIGYKEVIVKKGTVICEIAGIPEDQMKEALRKAGNKLNVTTKIVKRGELPHE